MRTIVDWVHPTHAEYSSRASVLIAKHCPPIVSPCHDWKWCAELMYLIYPEEGKKQQQPKKQEVFTGESNSENCLEICQKVQMSGKKTKEEAAAWIIS